ncbi:unnamed protein product [Mytilus edulis]|uniref:IgGFc-binding protein N-terminal domain-containing protein n=1 Tax=Mytilus edulis TaxID=6550 RepID=A0A8S3SYG0_MYTED|nr:unnamed protein product [Mytilus edulis]
MNYANVVTEGYLGIPQNGLGSKYIVSSFSHDMSEFGIIAPSNDTVISINLRLKSGDLKYNGHTYRPAGQYLEVTNYKPTTIRSSTGILVQLYCDSNGLSYDSVMVTLPAVQHFKAEYQFVVVSDFPPGYQPNNYYMTVIIPTNAVVGLKYDGYLLVSFIQKSSIVMSGQTYSILIKEISRSGLHTLTQVNNVTFGLIINGKTTHQGYAYPAGFQFNNGAP